MHYDPELYKDKSGEPIGGGFVPDEHGATLVPKPDKAPAPASRRTARTPVGPEPVPPTPDEP